MKKILILFVAIFSISLLGVNAEEVLDATLYSNDEVTEEAVTVSADLTDSFEYKIQDKYTIEKEVNGSGLYIGQDIMLNNNIDGIGMLIAKKMVIEGNLDYGILLSQNISLNSIVSRDLFLATDVVKISKDTVINRDLFMFANTATIEGNIVRDALIGASRVIIKSGTTIGGNIKIGANNITIEDNVNIVGKLKYNDNASVSIKNKDQFDIEVYHGEFVGNNDKKSTGLLMFVYKVIGMFIMFAITLLIFPNFIEKFKKLYNNSIDYLKNMGIGLGLVILIPIVLLLLLVLPFVSAFVFTTFALYFIIMYYSFIISGYLIGQFVKEQFKIKKINQYLLGLIGITIVNLLCLLPLINMFVIIFGFGSVFMLILNKKN